MEPESIKILIALLGVVVTIAAFMRSGFVQTRKEFREEIQSVRGELHGLAASQREDFRAFAAQQREDFRAFTAQQREDFQAFAAQQREEMQALAAQQRELAAQQREDNRKLAKIAERTAFIEGMLRQQWDSGPQSKAAQAVRPPTTIVEQKRPQSSPQPKATQAIPRK